MAELSEREEQLLSDVEEKEKRVAELEAMLGEVCCMCVDVFWCLGKLVELVIMDKGREW